jgi:hypothetical protein
LSLSGKFGTALALGLSLVANLVLALDLAKSYREREKALQSIHSLVQMQSSRISALSNEVDKLKQQLRNRLQKSADIVDKNRGQTEPTLDANTFGRPKAGARVPKIWLPGILQEPLWKPIPLKPA